MGPAGRGYNWGKVVPVLPSASSVVVHGVSCRPCESASNIYKPPHRWSPAGVSLTCADSCVGGVLSVPPHRTVVPCQILVRGGPWPVLRLRGADQAAGHWTLAIRGHSGHSDNWQPSNFLLAAPTDPVDGSCGLEMVSTTHTAHQPGGMRLVSAWAVSSHACSTSDGPTAIAQPVAVLVSIQSTCKISAEQLAA